MIEGAASSALFGGGTPADEGRIAAEAMGGANDGTQVGGVDPLTEVPDDGLITVERDKHGPVERPRLYLDL